MCDPETAERILKAVMCLPESEARKVLHFAESLTLPMAEDTLLEDFIRTLPTITIFQGKPVEIQKAMRRDWD